MSSRNQGLPDDSRRNDVFHGLRGVRRRRCACRPADEVAIGNFENRGIRNSTQMGNLDRCWDDRAPSDLSFRKMVTHDQPIARHLRPLF
jgi:hypothetical protein